MTKTIGIIGGGPAGMSCGLWLKNLGFVPTILEKGKQLGGAQNLSPFTNLWYLGLPGHSGIEIAQHFDRHIQSQQIPVILDRQIKSITQEKENFQITTDQNKITVKSIVIATGQRIKGYESIRAIPGISQLLSSPQVCFNPGNTPLLFPQVEGKVVAIVGGGDNGLGTAIYLSPKTKNIHLFIRSSFKGFSCNQEKVLELIKKGNLTLYKQSKFEKIERQGDQIKILFQDSEKSPKNILCDYLCFRIGFAPNVEEISQIFNQGGLGNLELSSDGYIATDGFGRTSIPGVYAAGDVTNPRDPCVATAVAQGAVVARSLEEDLQRSQTNPRDP